MQATHDLESVSDDALLQRLVELLRQSRRVEADLVAHIGEVDQRRLYAREASPSMFAYCTEVLRLSEAEAYLRIAAARASREHPVLLAMLADGRLHLTGVAKLAPHLTLENRAALLVRAAHKSKREIEVLVAELAPRPDAPAVIRRLPLRRAETSFASSLPTGPETGPAALGLRPDGVTRPPELGPEGGAGVPGRARPARVEPLAPARYKVQFTASAELHHKLERLQALMRSSVPDGDLAAVVDAAVTEKLESLEARRFARTRRPGKPRSSSKAVTAVPVGGEIRATARHIPAAVRRAVYERDEGRCRYVNAEGRRCTERDRLEFHHRHPFGFGGDHSVENVSLLCPTHNRHLAEVDYGPTAMTTHRRSRKPVGEPAAPPSP